MGRIARQTRAKRLFAGILGDDPAVMAEFTPCSALDAAKSCSDAAGFALRAGREFPSVTDMPSRGQHQPKLR
jgi:hypothetical protein